MTVHLPLPFASEAASLRKHLRTEQDLTPDQRLRAVADAVNAVETLSRAGQVRPAQLQYQQRLEEEWQRRIKEFINQHGTP